MEKETGLNQFNGVNINEAYLGPWVPRPDPLPKALIPYVQNVGGRPSVPARLFNRTSASKPTTQK